MSRIDDIDRAIERLRQKKDILDENVSRLESELLSLGLSKSILQIGCNVQGCNEPLAFTWEGKKSCHDHWHKVFKENNND